MLLSSTQSFSFLEYNSFKFFSLVLFSFFQFSIVFFNNYFCLWQQFIFLTPNLLNFCCPELHSQAIIFYIGKTLLQHLLEGSILKTHYCGKQAKKALHLVGIKPTTSLLHGVRFTAMLQPLPNDSSSFISSMSQK